jgi:hypothetical protein
VSRLTQVAKKSLARHHTLAVSASIRFTPTGGIAAARAAKATLKSSKK